MLLRSVIRVAKSRVRPAASQRLFSYNSDSGNVSYSGGQPTEQGGFYGSGGARAMADPKSNHRPEAVARMADITHLQGIMEDVAVMEAELARAGKDVSSKTIELKSAIKKSLSSPGMVELLGRLEINNQPVWGLTQQERELVREARQKFNMS
ncbi:unnamed protein product [Chrysoparadoxa australica]